MNMDGKCFLCSADAQPKAKWSHVLDAQVSESLCKLLEESSSVLEFFSNADYCAPCQEFVLDIDFLMRSFMGMQTKLQECRTILSRCLMDNSNLWTTTDDDYTAEFDTETEGDIKPITTSLESDVSLNTPAGIPTETNNISPAGSAVMEVEGRMTLCESSLKAPVLIHQRAFESLPNPGSNDALDHVTTSNDTFATNRNAFTRNSENISIDIDTSPEVMDVSESDYTHTIDVKVNPEFSPVRVEPILITRDRPNLSSEPTTLHRDSTTSITLTDNVPMRRQTRSSIVAKAKPAVSYKEIASESESEPDQASLNGDLDFVVNASDSDSDSVEEAAVHTPLSSFSAKVPDVCTVRTDKSDGVGKNKAIDGLDPLILQTPGEANNQIGSSDTGKPKRGRPRKGEVRITTVKTPRRSKTGLKIDPGPGGRYECYFENCTRNYLTIRALLRHIFVKHTNRTKDEDDMLFRTRHPCEETGCSFFSRSKAQLKVHVQQEHQNDDRPFKCTTCSNAYSNPVCLANHNSTKHKKKDCVCDICGEAFSTKHELQKHFRFKHNDVERFKCQVCGKKLLFEEDRKRHEERHVRSQVEDRVTWTCVVVSCYNQFENQHLLKGHVRDVHDDLTVKVCHICGATFKFRHRLTYHLMKHENALPFECSKCDKRFRSDVNRRSHFDIVHGPKDNVYSCTLCDKTFYCRPYLSKHMSWHRHGDNANKPRAKQKHNS